LQKPCGRYELLDAVHSLLQAKCKTEL